CLRHVVVRQDGRAGQETSVTAEADRVVELVLEHARTRPRESLGVTALGARHAERIDLALRAALAGVEPEVEAFFAEDAAEPFFVKNLERVQGDERDAVILSVGCGKPPAREPGARGPGAGAREAACQASRGRDAQPARCRNAQAA
ncbi:MAG TPA: hypothetical protein VFV73_10935, partial [Streptosporangiaceae bacterium]|nr:hypothetical protein [Streptosporangiaceae bacterium]